jgi:hypothetical protein
MRGLKTAKEAKNKISEVHPAVKVAIGIMLRQAKHDLPAAAREAGLSAARLRDYLSRPSVIQYLRSRRRVEVESMCAGNINALARVRDTSENGMAVIGAVKQSEQIRSQLISEDGVAGAQKATPGLVIIVGQPQGVTVEQPQRRLAGARTVLELGANDPRPAEDAVLLGDAEVAATPK